MQKELQDILQKTTHERMFPILNKFDRIWEHNEDLTFCEVYQDIIKDFQISENNLLTDLQFTKLMDDYIEKNNIT